LWLVLIAGRRHVPQNARRLGDGRASRRRHNFSRANSLAGFLAFQPDPREKTVRGALEKGSRAMTIVRRVRIEASINVNGWR
jgi:hypothetical protein